MLYPEPLPARLGRVAAGFSPPLAARLTSLALELAPEQAQRFLSLVVDLDDEATGHHGGTSGAAEVLATAPFA